MKIAIRGGHSLDIRGASAILDEVTEDRKITAKVVEYLQQLGHEVLDVTPTNSGVSSVDLSVPVNTANTWGADYFCSVHLNCSNGVGLGEEVLYKSEKGKEYADRISSKLVELGFQNRGSKLDERGLYEFNHTIMPNNIVEVCFIDNQNDVDLYNSIGIDRIAQAISEGITGETIQSQSEPTQPTLDMSRLPSDFSELFYRYANPDVNQKIIDGTFKSGVEHYCLYGYADKPTRIYKPCLPKDWSSDGYMSLNEDIRQAVENKSIPSPSWHWIVQGWIENMANPNDRKYKDNDEPPIFYGEIHQEIPTPVVEPVKEVEEVKTPIMGTSILSAEQMVTFLLKNNPQPKLNGMNPLEFCKLYIEEGNSEGIRGDIAFCQSIHETGFFSFQGIVLPDQCNYSGIGATNPILSHVVIENDTLEDLAKKYYTKVDLIKTLNNLQSDELIIGVVLQLPPPLGKGNWFDNQRTGIKAQIQHLKCYSSTEPLKQECVDPRFNLVTRGIAPYINDLGGKWASPGYEPSKYSSFEEAYKNKATYGQMIMSVYDRMVSTEVDEDLIKSLQLVVEVPSEKPVEIVDNNNNELINLQTKLNNVTQELEDLKSNIDDKINNIITNLKQ
jgi:N-acetylmuramoyl-L-alanine amidase